MTQFKVESQYIVNAQDELFRVAIVDLTEKSIRVENLDNGKMARVLISDFTPAIIEEIKPQVVSDVEIKTEVSTKSVADFDEFIKKSLSDIEYVNIPMFGGQYKINKKGRIKSFKNNKVKMLTPNSVSKVQLYKKGTPTTYSIEELIAMTFNEPKKDELVVWKDLEGFGGMYKINKEGDIINNKTNRQLKLMANRYYLLRKPGLGTKSFFKNDLINQNFN